MLSNKIHNLILRPQSSLYQTFRYVRGGRTILITPEKEKKRKPPQVQRNLEFKELRKSNPGAGRFLHFIRKRDGELDPDMDVDDYERTGLYDSNIKEQFDGVHHAEKCNMNQKTFYNVKRKYYKEPTLPNMVPYIEKQDMKILHEKDPEEWNVEKLSECFPVTPEIAKKIVRSPFTAHTTNSVRKHDRAVQNNWKLFKEGKLDLSDELKLHYSKFVDRMTFDISDRVIKKYLPEKPNFEVHLTKKEFGSIIDKYEETKTGKKPDNVQIDQDHEISIQDVNANVKTISESDRSFTRAKHVTLDALRKKIKSNPANASEMSKLIVEMENKYIQPPIKKEVQTVSDSDHLQDAEIVNRMYELSLPKKEEIFKLRIKIPRKQWKRNQLYQLKDCFYDDTGHFLYKVPGLFS